MMHMLTEKEVLQTGVEQDIAVLRDEMRCTFCHAPRRRNQPSLRILTPRHAPIPSAIVP